MILELQKSFDMLLIQEPLWRLLRHTAAMDTSDGDEVWGPPIHPDWILVVPPKGQWTNQSPPRVITYIHK